MDYTNIFSKVKAWLKDNPDALKNKGKGHPIDLPRQSARNPFSFVACIDTWGMKVEAANIHGLIVPKQPEGSPNRFWVVTPDGSCEWFDDAPTAAARVRELEGRPCIPRPLPEPYL